jgi:hypothetical protein
MPSSATERTARCATGEDRQAGTGRSRPQCEPGKAGDPPRCAGVYLGGSRPAAPNAVSARDTAQKLAEAITRGDVEGAQTLLAAFQSEVIARVGAAQSPLEREALLEEGTRSTKTLLHLARSLRAYASASLRETNRQLGYSGPTETPRTWRLEA